MLVKLQEIRETADNIKTFVFQPPSPVRYLAGQFIELLLPHHRPDKRGTKRWFTLSSSPSESYLSITTKLASENGSSFKTALQGLTPGSLVQMSSPMGDFVLPKNSSLPLVFVAGGIGITPMRSMIKYLVDRGETRNIHLMYAANKLGELAFADLFDSAPIKFTKILRDLPTGWKGEIGILDTDRVLRLAGSTDRQFYLSGPEPMVEALESSLKSAGVKKIATDFFPGYTAQ